MSKTDCSPDTQQTQEIRGYSGSKTGLSESSLYEKSLCDYVGNPAKGCPHACAFCYNRAAPQYRFDPGDEIEAHGADGSDDWGEYALYRTYFPEAVAKDLQRGLSEWTEGGRGIVGLSFGTDPYFDTEVAELTGQTLRLLRDHCRPTRILTRNPHLAWSKHQQLLVEMAEQDCVTVGTSAPSLRENEVAAIEQSTIPVENRLDALAKISAAGVPVFVSMSPTYPTQGRDDIRATLEAIAMVDPDVVFHEPINPRKGNYDACVEAARDAGEDDLAAELNSHASGQAWVDYCCQHFRWVQEEGEDLGLPIHLWPDQSLINRVEESRERWLQEWKDRESPEDFAGRPDPETAPPTPPARENQTLSEVIE